MILSYDANLGRMEFSEGTAGFPSPERTEAFAMPTHDRLRSDDRYGVKNARKTAIEPNEQSAISPG
jgi:hypothetical protein